MDELHENNNEIKLNKSLLERFNQSGIKGDITREEFNEFQKLLLENQQTY